ncbi:hypothetical protein EJ07DRAFT_120131 [Lizonia empirigonia]|nr:hypothetical protein EJ07DRAFT_120131 [Lizonia empirigonia]
MLNAFNKFFTAKAPTITIAGAELTNEEATKLIRACSSLEQVINLQLQTIAGLPSIQVSQISSKFRLIQSRHLDLQNYLSPVVLKTRNSVLSWAYGFSDAQKALEKKIVSINRCSRGSGWIATSQQYWPVVAETYTWLLALVVRLHNELREALGDKEPRSAEICPEQRGQPDLNLDQEHQRLVVDHTNLPRVRFGREVTVQEYRIGESIGERAKSIYCVKLTDDKKNTAGALKAESVKYEVMLGSFPPMPL